MQVFAARKNFSALYEKDGDWWKCKRCSLRMRSGRCWVYTCLSMEQSS